MSKFNINRHRKQLDKIYFPKVCAEVSEKTGICEEKVQRVISHFFITFKCFVDSPFLVKIKIIGLGTFTPNRATVVRRYVTNFKNYFTGECTRDQFIEREVKYRTWLKKLDADLKGSREKNPTYKNYWRKLFKNYLKTRRKNGSINGRFG